MSEVFLSKDRHLESIELILLHDIASVLSSSLNLNDTLSRIFDLLDLKLGLKRSILTLTHPLKEFPHIDMVHNVSQQDLNKPVFQRWNDITHKILNLRQVFLITLDGRMMVFGHHTAEDLEQSDYICLPIFLGNDALGTLSIHGDFVFKKDFYQTLKLFFVVTLMIAQEIKLKSMMEVEKQDLRRENILLKDELKDKYSIDNMIGNSSVMLKVYEGVTQVSNSNANVLIYGESGTGKELVAHAIHYRSSRADFPFIKINCGAIPDSLIESELFGYEKGAFTDAHERRLGKFEAAHLGTVFLDEVGELPLATQVKLLRVIQEREFLRVGGVTPVKVNVRIIAATNLELEKEMKAGRFRQDLYYRLHVFPIFVPPLKDRRSDILLLAEHFLNKYARENHCHIQSISSAAIELLLNYSWPGNVRELENSMQRAVLVCDSLVLESRHLPLSLQPVGSVAAIHPEASLEALVSDFERAVIMDALSSTQGNQLRAAKLLKTTQRILGYKIKNLGIDPLVYK